MKRIQTFFSMLICSAIGLTTQAQSQSGVDSTGLPGDNFSLQGALQMFKNASSPEEFEKMLNTEGNHVNNLDLNGDGDIDYIRVIDKMDKGNHVFILQVPVSDNENQDIAVIELEKTGEASAVLQIIGDEDIYGEQTIVEPNGDEKDSGFILDKKNDSGPSADEEIISTESGIVINVWFWPCVRFVYAPVYRPWVSPWRWRAYPVWWHPWHPIAWRVFHPFHLGWHRSFVVCHTHRVVRAHAVYTPFRASSTIVRTRHSTAVGHYRVTRTTTIKKGPGGGKVKTTKTTVRKRGKGRG